MIFISDKTENILNINKPKFWTSFQVVKRVRNLLKIKKVGHAGTLDPLATGVLILGLDKGTKALSKIQNETKDYHMESIVGASTPSLDTEFWPQEITDLENTNLRSTDFKELTKQNLQSLANQKFLGKIHQIPPAYSAIKIKGERAYKAVRKGREVFLPPREIEIFEFEILEIKFLSLKELLQKYSELNPNLKAEDKPIYQDQELATNLMFLKSKITCSKGTYIRSLAKDFAQELGYPAFLIDLVRTRIGNFNLKDSYQLKDLEKFKIY